MGGRRPGNPLRAAFLAVIFLTVPFAPPALEGQVVLSEVLFDSVGVNTGQQVVEIENQGLEDADIGGYWLSFKPAAWQFPPKPLILPRGGVVLVHLNRSGASTGTEFYTGTAGQRNLAREDSLSLFSDQPFSDPADLVDFVEWGSAGKDGEDVAVAAGKWGEADPIVVTLLREGSTIAFTGAGFGAAAWCIDGSPSLGAHNDDCTISLAKSPVRLNEVIPGPGGTVEMLNAGTVLEDLGEKWLLSKPPSAFKFPAGTILIPGQILLVHLGATGTDGKGNVFTGPLFGDLNGADSIAFTTSSTGISPTSLIDFVEWGGTGMSFESQAVQVGLWPAGGTLDVSGLVKGGSLASKDGGTGLDRWTIDNTPTPGALNSAPPARTLWMNEVLVDPPLGESQAVEIVNSGPTFANLSGYRLCTRSREDPGTAFCATLPPEAVVVSHGYLVVRIGVDQQGPGIVSLPLFPTLDVVADELALLVAPDSENPNNFLDYLRWGPGTPVLETTAHEAGLWEVGEAIDVTGMVLGSSIAYKGTGRGPASFRIDLTPSLGFTNDETLPDHDFVRSDCNQDGAANITDAVAILGFLFLGNERPLCERACDSNDDALVNLTDAIHMLAFLFLGTAQQKPPIECGPQPVSNALTCVDFSCP